MIGARLWPQKYLYMVERLIFIIHLLSVSYMTLPFINKASCIRYIFWPFLSLYLHVLKFQNERQLILEMNIWIIVKFCLRDKMNVFCCSAYLIFMTWKDNLDRGRSLASRWFFKIAFPIYKKCIPSSFIWTEN